MKEKFTLIKNYTALIFLAVLVLFAIMVVFMVTPTKAFASSTDFGGGNGSLNSPYIISTDVHMQRLSTNVQGGGVNGYYGEYFKLENDIDLTEISQGVLSGWMPIGTSLYPFRGTFARHDESRCRGIF